MMERATKPILLFVIILLIVNQSSVKGCAMQNLDNGADKKSTVDSLKITILYDNYKSKIDTINDWGFSCLIEGTEKTILYDSGAMGEILLSNIDKLNINLKKVDLFFLSHNHSDHNGGIKTVLSINPNILPFISASIPADFEKNYGLTKVTRLGKPTEICSGVFSTGEMGDQIKEQSLIINTPKGLVIITGCSHQGIVEILKRAKEIYNKNIYLVFGGFHLLKHSDEEMEKILNSFKELGVENCGATHCTGEKQIQMFKNAFKDNYIEMGTGRVVLLSKNGIELK